MSELNWWESAIIYQIYPRSFFDGCAPACTGTGSLRGIESKLQYRHQLRGSVLPRQCWVPLSRRIYRVAPSQLRPSRRPFLTPPHLTLIPPPS